LGQEKEMKDFDKLVNILDALFVNWGSFITDIGQSENIDEMAMTIGGLLQEDAILYKKLKKEVEELLPKIKKKLGE
jgi:hypothetical protein